jgi:hypothetical protein
MSFLRTLIGAIRARNIAKLFEDSTMTARVKNEIIDGARDAAVCARQLGIVHSRIRGIQKTLFNDTEQILPEISADDVNEANRRISGGNAEAKAAG